MEKNEQEKIRAAFEEVFSDALDKKAMDKLRASVSQTKKDSILEQLFDTGTGFVISYLVWEFILKRIINEGYISIDNTFTITIIFTVISVVRGYCWRRIFNRKGMKCQEKKK